MGVSSLVPREPGQAHRKQAAAREVGRNVRRDQNELCRGRAIQEFRSSERNKCGRLGGGGWVGGVLEIQSFGFMELLRQTWVPENQTFMLSVCGKQKLELGVQGGGWVGCVAHP